MVPGEILSSEKKVKFLLLRTLKNSHLFIRMVVPFSKLSDELLLNIFEYLATDELSTAAQVCRRWYRSIEANGNILYRNLRLNCRNQRLSLCLLEKYRIIAERVWIKGELIGLNYTEADNFISILAESGRLKKIQLKRCSLLQSYELLTHIITRNIAKQLKSVQLIECNINWTYPRSAILDSCLGGTPKLTEFVVWDLRNDYQLLEQQSRMSNVLKLHAPTLEVVKLPIATENRNGKSNTSLLNELIDNLSDCVLLKELAIHFKPSPQRCLTESETNKLSARLIRLRSLTIVNAYGLSRNSFEQLFAARPLTKITISYTENLNDHLLVNSIARISADTLEKLSLRGGFLSCVTNDGIMKLIGKCVHLKKLYLFNICIGLNLAALPIYLPNLRKFKYFHMCMTVGDSSKSHHHLLYRPLPPYIGLSGTSNFNYIDLTELKSKMNTQNFAVTWKCSSSCDKWIECNKKPE